MSWQHLNQPQGWIGVISLSLSVWMDVMYPTYTKSMYVLGMNLSPPLYYLYVCLTPFSNFCRPLMPCFWDNLDFCPRTCPSQNATLCTYSRWFSRPLGSRHSLLNLPISARCMRVLLRFRMGCHSLPVVSRRRSGVPRHQRFCLHCASNVVGDKRQMVVDRTALQPVREQ